MENMKSSISKTIIKFAIFFIIGCFMGYFGMPTIPLIVVLVILAIAYYYFIDKN